MSDMWRNGKPAALVLIIALLSIGVRDALARDIHVNIAGTAAEEKGTVAAPFKKIQAAMNAASPGDTIRIAPGIYSERVVVNKSDLTILGAGRSLTAVDAGVVTLKDNGKDCFTFNAANAYLAGLTLRRGHHVFSARNAGKVTIASCNIESTTSYGCFGGNTQVDIVNCSMTNVPVAASYGLAFGRCRIRIIGNLMADNKRGVMADWRCSGYITANVMYNHSENGVLCASNTNQMRIERNLFMNVRIYPIGWRQDSFPLVIGNTIINCNYGKRSYSDGWSPKGDQPFLYGNSVAGRTSRYRRGIRRGNITNPVRHSVRGKQIISKGATISGKIDSAGLPARVMAVRSDNVDREARWGTLDRLGTAVNADGSYEITGLGKGLYDLVVGVYLPGEGWALHCVTGLSLQAGLSGKTVKNGDKAEIEQVLKLLPKWSQRHDAETAAKLFSAKFRNDAAVKLISPAHSGKGFIDATIGKAEIRGVVSDGERANALVKFKCVSKGSAKSPLYADIYVSFIRAKGNWKISASRLLWLDAKKDTVYPAQYVLDDNLTGISLDRKAAHSRGHNYRFDMPLVKIAGPANSNTTAASTGFAVKGTITAAPGSKIAQAGVLLINRGTGPATFPIVLKKAGQFNCPVKLGPGRNELQINVRDDKGRQVHTGIFIVEVGR